VAKSIEVAQPRIVRDKRLTILHAAKALARYVEDLPDQIKDSMCDKGAQFAESDHVAGRLQFPTSGRNYIDPGKLLALYERGSITRAQLVSGLSVRAKPLSLFLTGQQIAAITLNVKGEESGSLYTDWKEGRAIEPEQLAGALLDAIENTQIIPPRV